MQIPALKMQTGCCFRLMNISDAQAIYEINTDRITRLYTSLFQQQTIDVIVSWLDYYPHYDRHGFGLWVIEHKESNKLAGLCGLRVRKDLDNRIDLSYRMHPEFRGKGIASAAVKTCVTWGFETLQLNDILAQVHIENSISLHILAKDGFVNESSDGIWADLVVKNPSKG
ncbi:MAG: GNAT family N-acetyltransferase [Sphingomonadales bacterium]|nr:GNAT family N-acetyltransferase [Sphingomonadales bacterium]